MHKKFTVVCAEPLTYQLYFPALIYVLPLIEQPGCIKLHFVYGVCSRAQQIPAILLTIQRVFDKFVTVNIDEFKFRR